MRVRFARIITCLAVILAPTPFATAEPMAARAPVSAAGQTVPASVSAFNDARDVYVSSLGVYVGHGRRSTSEYAVALRDYNTAQRLLQIARRSIAKTFKDSMHVAQKSYVANLKQAKTPEQKALVTLAWNEAIRSLGSDRDAATEALKPMPAAPPKPLRS